MDRQTKTEILFRYVTDLENDYGSVTIAEENGDKLFVEMREFVKLHFNDRVSESPLMWGKGSRWTEEEEKYLAKHFRAAYSIDDLAKALGRPKASIRGKAHRMGLSRY